MNDVWISLLIIAGFFLFILISGRRSSSRHEAFMREHFPEDYDQEGERQ